MTRRTYTNDFIQAVRAEYDAGDSSVTIGKRYNIAPSTIVNLLKKSGYTPRKPLKHTVDFKLIAKLKVEGKTNQEIADTLGIKLLTLKDWELSQFESPLKEKFGLKHNQKDLTFFERIDTELKAYILGWLTADGSITPSGMLRLELSKKDRDVVDLIKDTLSPTCTVVEYDRTLTNERTLSTVVFSCKCRKWADDLKQYGVIPAKSKSSERMPLLQEHLMRHYIRGFFEGNGSAHLTKSKVFYILTMVYGNHTYIQDLCNYLNDKLGLNTKVRRRETSCSDVTIYRKDDAYAFVNYIYQDTELYLNRKREKVKSMLFAT